MAEIGLPRSLLYWKRPRNSFDVLRGCFQLTELLGVCWLSAAVFTAGQRAGFLGERQPATLSAAKGRRRTGV
jgi:hypothetical protein